MSLNAALAFVPTAWIAVKQTITINANIMAYSTAVGPSSDFKNRETFETKFFIATSSDGINRHPAMGFEPKRFKGPKWTKPNQSRPSRGDPELPTPKRHKASFASRSDAGTVRPKWASKRQIGKDTARLLRQASGIGRPETKDHLISLETYGAIRWCQTIRVGESLFSRKKIQNG